eukprot:TRINITY_DN1996_c0_g1_i2.p1 TRINITY_DN1996_c0_g1~~TRINITY_DN1996_c0_g1_i2.p1  ORF type:complete len:118 (-),score=5.86 TRINITY_DN1996_c0_g1_i2:166-519(-)
MKAVVGAPTAADDEFTIPEDAPCPFSFSASASSGHQDDATRALIANGLVDVMQFRTHAQALLCANSSVLLALPLTNDDCRSQLATKTRTSPTCPSQGTTRTVLQTRPPTRSLGPSQA